MFAKYVHLMVFPILAFGLLLGITIFQSPKPTTQNVISGYDLCGGGFVAVQSGPSNTINPGGPCIKKIVYKKVTISGKAERLNLILLLCLYLIFFIAMYTYMLRRIAKKRPPGKRAKKEKSQLSLFRQIEAFVQVTLGKLYH